MTEFVCNAKMSQNTVVKRKWMAKALFFFEGVQRLFYCVMRFDLLKRESDPFLQGEENK